MDDFYEEDEAAEEIKEAYERGRQRPRPKGLTARDFTILAIVGFALLVWASFDPPWWIWLTAHIPGNQP